jgi:hypothetical protein
MLPAVPHITFGIFNLAIPNIIVWTLIVIVLFIAIRARLPKVFEAA